MTGHYVEHDVYTGDAGAKVSPDLMAVNDRRPANSFGKKDDNGNPEP